jgi:putative ABC transport system substrate-binding protein
MNRRWAIAGFLAAFLQGGPGRGAQPAQDLLVVYTSAIEPYVQAVDGVSQVLGRKPALLDLRKTPFTEEAARSARVVVAVGAEALQAVAPVRGRKIILGAMTLRADGEAAGLEHLVEVDVPLATLFKSLHTAFPEKRRLGLMWNPAYGSARKADALAMARAAGYPLTLAEAAGPAALLRSFTALRGRVDFVVCLPDALLYNSATVKPLILASLEHRLPIVAYSSAFLRAGAAVAVYPDFTEIGRQTGEAALRLLQGSTAPVEQGPRRLHVAVNQSVLRLLGIEQPRSGDVEIYR